MSAIDEYFRVVQLLEELRAAIRRSKIFKYHMDTCDSLLIKGYPCNCGHAELRGLLDGN